MPLNTQIKRDGKLLSVSWGGFHVAAMALAAIWDSGEGPYVDNSPPTTFNYPEEPQPISPKDVFVIADYSFLGNTVLNNGSYTLTGRHCFLDVIDGEVFELLPGDELIVSRSI